MVGIQVGDTYNSYAEFISVLDEYQRQESVFFTKQQSTKLTSIKLSPEDRERIVYDKVVYSCKQGAQRKSSSKGIRPRQKTYKMGCGARFKLKSKKLDPNQILVLCVTWAEMDHSNHPINAQTFKIYPEVRRIDFDENDECLKSLVRSEASLTEIKAHVKQRYNSDLFSKDIYNLRRRVKKVIEKTKQEPIMNVDLSTLRSQIEDGFSDDDINQYLEHVCQGGFFFINHAEDSSIRQITFSTKQMKEALIQFPDILIIDCLENVNAQLFPLLTVMCIDSNGRGRPVLHSLITNKYSTAILTCLKILRECIQHDEPNFLFINHDFIEPKLINEIFPQMNVKVMHFHPLSFLVKALVRHKLPPHSHTNVLNLFKEQKDTLSGELFYNLQLEISASLSPTAIDYFTTFWWNRPEQWASYATQDSNRLKRTALRCIERYHLQLKSRTNKLSSKLSLIQCIKIIVLRNSHLSEELDREITMSSMSQLKVQNDSVYISEIRDQLTPFGGDLVADQLTYSQMKEYLLIDHTEDGAYTISEENCPNNNNSYTVNERQCSCEFFTSLQLQCHHIFALRSYLELPLFEAVPSRFKKRGFVDQHESDCHIKCEAASLVTGTETSRSPGKLPPPQHKSSTNKSKDCVRKITSQLDDLMSKMEPRKCNKILDKLQMFVSLVQENKMFLVVDCSSEADDNEPSTSSISHENASSSSHTFSFSNSHVLSSKSVIKASQNQKEAIADKNSSQERTQIKIFKSVPTLNDNKVLVSTPIIHTTTESCVSETWTKNSQCDSIDVSAGLSNTSTKPTPIYEVHFAPKPVSTSDPRQIYTVRVANKTKSADELPILTISNSKPKNVSTLNDVNKNQPTPVHLKRPAQTLRDPSLVKKPRKLLQ